MMTNPCARRASVRVKKYAGWRRLSLHLHGTGVTSRRCKSHLSKTTIRGGNEMRKAVQLFAVVGMLAWVPLQAQARTGQWSVLTGETVGNNATAVHVQGGWPGISATLLHGYTPTVDFGGIFTFYYGVVADVDRVDP